MQRLYLSPQLIEFYIRTNIQLSGDKAADSCLIVLGEQNTAWKQAIKAELKADKKQVMVGLASISKDGKMLQLQIELGAAKKSLVRKGIKTR